MRRSQSRNAPTPAGRTNCSRFAAWGHALAGVFDQSTLPMQIETLCPPKPSEFDIALRTFNGRAEPGT